MKIISGNYFIAGVRYPKMSEDGTIVKVSEQYVVEAQSWTESESAILQELNGTEDLDITSMKKAKFYEAFVEESENMFYEVGISLVVLDEMSGKERRTKISVLVQGESIEMVRKNTEEGMKDTISDYVINSIKETSIVDIIS